MGRRAGPAFWYAWRLRRWTGAGWEGWGEAAASRSIEVSKYVASALTVAASGRWAFGGGMAPVRSLRMTFSQTSACADGAVRSTPASDRPPVFRRSLWQGTQYFWTVADGAGAGCPARRRTASNTCIGVILAPMRRAPLAAVLLFIGASASAATPLTDAAKRGDMAAVRTLVAKKVDVNAPDADGSTALPWAAERDDVPMADLLIAAGANVKAKTRYNVTPLALAATNGDAALIDRLLKAGADPNGASEEGQTALMTASLTGKPDAVKLLIEAGANVNTAEPYKGQTALMWAASEGNASAADVLIAVCPLYGS